MSLPPPSALLGLPKFDHWYKNQDQVFRDVTNWYYGSKRFLGLALPTGSGKTLLSILTAKLLSKRTIILTATKGLQDQLISDFGSIGAVIVKGQNNFFCRLPRYEDRRCDTAPCHEGRHCDLRNGGCPYYDQYETALHSQIVVTNYAYYLSQSRYGNGLGDIDLLILDEAHTAFQALESHLSFTLFKSETDLLGLKQLPSGSTWEQWRDWAIAKENSVREARIEQEEAVSMLHKQFQKIPRVESDNLRSIRNLHSNLIKLSGIDEQWIIREDKKDKTRTFVPVWMQRYGDRLWDVARKKTQESEQELFISKADLQELGVVLPSIENLWLYFLQAEVIKLELSVKEQIKVIQANHTGAEGYASLQSNKEEFERVKRQLQNTVIARIRVVLESRIAEMSRIIERQEREDDSVSIPSELLHRLDVINMLKEKLSIVGSKQWTLQHSSTGYLFSTVHLVKVPKIMLMSAILSPKTMDSIGVPASREFISVGSSFPPQNTPIWHVASARINYNTDDYGTKIWLTRIDQIISRRLDRKGIIFTVSYPRRDLIFRNSSYSDIMLTHQTKDVSEIVAKFKSAAAPAILVSPTVTTGWDFPEASYIIIGKVMYGDTSDPVVQARHDADKEWGSYLAMNNIIQAAGRGSRSFDAKCEVFVLDDSWLWFYPKYKHFAAKWFQERVRGSLQTVPDVLI